MWNAKLWNSLEANIRENLDNLGEWWYSICNTKAQSTKGITDKLNSIKIKISALWKTISEGGQDKDLENIFVKANLIKKKLLSKQRTFKTIRKR